jgi:outer membrane autotransporter protein
MTNDEDAAAATLTIGAVTGTGTLIVSGTGGDVQSAFTVSGSTLGTSSVALAEVEVIGGVGHATDNNAATLTTSSTLNTTLLTVTGGAAITTDEKFGHAATATIGGNAIIGGGGIALTGGAAHAGNDEVGGAATITLSGTTTITGGAVAITGGVGVDAAVGGASAITFTGDVTSDSALALVGAGGHSNGSGGAATATFGGDVTFSAITLDVGTTGGGAAGLTFNGAGAQTVTGAIAAAADNEGTITISNTHASGVTFASSIGGAAADGADDVDTLTIGTTTAGSVATFNSTVFVTDPILIGIDAAATAANTTEGSSATFKATVTGGGFTMGANDADVKTNNLTFDATTASFVATGGISGGVATDVNTVTVTGGASGAAKTVTFATTMGANIDTLAIGDYTTLISTAATAAIKAGAITIGTSGVIQTTVTAAVITGTIDGTSAGVGTLDINEGTTLAGKVGNTFSLAAIDIASGQDLLTTTGTDVIKATSINFEAATSEFTTATTATTITGNLVAASDGVGVLDVDIATTIVGNVGSSNVLDLLTTNVGAGLALTVSGNYYVATTTLVDGTSELKFNGSEAQTVEGLITTGTAGLGVVTVGAANGSSNVTFASVVGTTALDLFTVTSGSTANITNAINFTATGATAGLDVNGTLNVSSAAGAVALGAVTSGSIDIDGTLGVTGANDVTLTALDTNALIAIDGTLTTALTGSNKELRLASIASASSLNIGKTSNTTLNLGNQVVTTGDVAIGDTSRENTINIKKTAAFNPTTATTGVVIDAAGDVVTVVGILNVALASDSHALADGAEIVVIDGSSNAGTSYATLVTNTTGNQVRFTDTAMIDLQDNTSTAQDLLMKVVYKTDVAGVAGQNETSLRNALTAATASSDNTVFATLATLTTTQTEDSAEKVQPDAGAATGAALAAVSGVNNVISGRQANTRVAFNTLGNQSGVSTGDAANDAVVWAQIFGSSATQDKVGTLDGYDADSSGLALGWETDKSGDLMGLSVSYSDSDVDGKSASASHTDTTATQVAAYGTVGKATDWMVGYASADNDTKRTALTGTALGKYDSSIFTAKVGHAFTSSNTGAWTMTPKVDATYTNIDNDGYTETGAGNLNLIVASSSNDILTARAGAEFTQRIVDGDAVTIPHINIMAGYDLKNDGGETSSTFTGGGSAFTTKGADPEKASLQLGFGVDHVSDDSTVSFDLNADLRNDYDNMSGSITFKSKF